MTSLSDTSLLSRVAVQPTCFSDHDLVTCHLHVPCDPPTVARYQYRDIRRIDIAAFQNDIIYSRCCIASTEQRQSTTASSCSTMRCTVQQIVDKHAPLKSQTRRIGRNNRRWLSAEAREAKRRCRRKKRRYRRSQFATDRQAFQAARATARAAITRSKTDAIKQRFDETSGDAAATWRVVRDVLHRNQ